MYSDEEFQNALWIVLHSKYVCEYSLDHFLGRQDNLQLKIRMMLPIGLDLNVKPVPPKEIEDEVLTVEVIG